MRVVRTRRRYLNVHMYVGMRTHARTQPGVNVELSVHIDMVSYVDSYPLTLSAVIYSHSRNCASQVCCYMYVSMCTSMYLPPS